MGDNSGALYCWNVTEGFGSNQPLWKFADIGDVKSTAAVHGDLVYLSSWDQHIYALNKLTGAMVWKYATSGMSMSSPSVDASRRLVVVGSNDGYVYGLDASTGDLRWSFKTGRGIISSATLLPHDNVGVIGSGDRYVYVFALDDGQVVQRLELASRLTGVPVVVGRQLYLFDHLGFLYHWAAI